MTDQKTARLSEADVQFFRENGYLLPGVQLFSADVEDDLGWARFNSISSVQTSGLVNSRQVKELPLNGRSYDQLISLNPGTVNYTKLELRNDPVYPSDVTFLRQPGFLFEMVPVSKVVLGAIGLVVVVVVAAVAGWLIAKVFPGLSWQSTGVMA